MRRYLNPLLIGIALFISASTSYASTTYYETDAPNTSHAAPVAALNVGDQLSFTDTTIGSGQVFIDGYNFSVASAGGLNGDVVKINLSGDNIAGLSMYLYDDSKPGDPLIAGGKNIKSFILPSVTPLDSLLLDIAGTGSGTNGGAYSGLLQVTAVPLPAAVWLMLSGIAGMGLVMRKRAA